MVLAPHKEHPVTKDKKFADLWNLQNFGTIKYILLKF